MHGERDVGNVEALELVDRQIGPLRDEQRSHLLHRLEQIVDDDAQCVGSRHEERIDRYGRDRRGRQGRPIGSRRDHERPQKGRHEAQAVGRGTAADILGATQAQQLVAAHIGHITRRNGGEHEDDIGIAVDQST